VFTRTRKAVRPSRGARLLLGLAWVLASAALAYAQPVGDGPPHFKSPPSASEGPPHVKVPPSEGGDGPPPKDSGLGAIVGGILGQMRIMPRVTGMPVDRAESMLVGVGLRRIQTRTTPSDQPRTMVLQQSPRAGVVVALSSPVTLTLSDASLVRVPDLAGQTPGEARTTLGSQLQLGQGRLELSDARPAGRILTTDPAAGSLAPIGSRLAFTVATDVVVVPDLRGRTPDEARSILSEGHLQLGAGSERFDRGSPGQILSTDPPAKTRVRIGSLVAYALSTNRLAVPEVVGLSEAAAASALDKAGFPHATEPVGQGEQKVDVVSRQDPAGGAVVAIDTTVRLTLKQEALPPAPAPPTPPTNVATQGTKPPPQPPPSATPAGAAQQAPPPPPPVKVQPKKGQPWPVLAVAGVTAVLTLAAAALAAVGWSASWPLRTKVAVALGGFASLPAGAEPVQTAPETRLSWVVEMEPPLAEESPTAESKPTQEATHA
jgi:beta-lactam-binding protein with PASTA domain